MKTVLLVKKYFQENWLPISIITMVTLLVWHKLLNIVPSDYAYFGPLDFTDLRQLTLKSFLTSFSIFSQIIFLVLVPVFRDNLFFYMLFQLLVMLVIYQTLYFVFVKITKEKVVSLLATIFFTTNYVGSLTMLGIGNAQRFFQRIPNLPFVLISFYFLSAYVEKKRTKYLIAAFILFVVSILLSHFDILLLPIFVIYPVIYSLINKRSLFFIKSVFVSLSFFALAILLTQGDSLTRPSNSSLVFVQKTPGVAQMVLYQISSVSFPQQLTIYLSQHFSPQIPYPYLQTQNFILIFVGALAVMGLIKGKKYSKILPLYITCFLSLFFLSFATIYAYGAVPNPILFFGEDRIYFVHSLLIAFVWAALAKFFFGKNKKIYSLLALLIGVIFIVHNTPLIWKDIDKYQYRSNAYKAFIDYTRSLSPSFSNNTVIVAPPNLIRTTDPFIRRFYKLDKAAFIAFEDGWTKQVLQTKTYKKDVFVLDYKYGYDVKGDINPMSVVIVDKSEDFRQGKKVEPFVKP